MAARTGNSKGKDPNYRADTAIQVSVTDIATFLKFCPQLTTEKPSNLRLNLRLSIIRVYEALSRAVEHTLARYTLCPN